MPYPESCPECGGAFRNTGTHFTARRNEIGRHVLLELGCQNTSRRFWWDFTTGSVTEDGRTVPARRAATLAAASNGLVHAESNGHITLSTLDRPEPQAKLDDDLELEAEIDSESDPQSDSESDSEVDMPPHNEVSMNAAPSDSDDRLQEALASLGASFAAEPPAAEEDTTPSRVLDLPGQPPVAAPALKDAFVRQLQLDRLTMRQMRSWLMSEDARRAIEVAAGATEATYERLALILFGVDLPQLLGKQPTAPVSTGMSAEERLELQRDKARIRARLRRAAAKAARQQG
ncbi:MAG TPA: hypothetical protein VGQ62_20665 [Chloroflexota bacterium]|jgi:hypothetical protein|nr:hypothetical protein [Chloroflexota bacterium]